MTRMAGRGWRTTAGALPAVALVGAGMALAATGGRPDTSAVAASRPVVTVPAAPLDRLDAPVLPPLPELPPPPEQAATPVEPPVDLPLALGGNGIPAAALRAYQRGAAIVDGADAGCHVDWALIAAIGKVESNHGRYGGNGVDREGTVRPGIYGVPLNGADSTALIHDADGGMFDHDTTWDRAVGPMQFIPSTWRSVGVDANGDGRKDPQNLDDAATATAVYLCSGPGDLRNEDAARSAVRRYNHSEPYVDEVMAIAAGYREGYTVVPSGPLTDSQRTGSPFLPSGDSPSVPSGSAPVQPASAPAGAGGTKGSDGAGAQPGSGGSGSGGSGSGGGSGSAPGSGGSLTGTLTGVVGGDTAPVTSRRPHAAPTQTPAPAASPSTATAVLPVIGPLGLPVCPKGYLPSVDGRSCTRL